MEKLFTNFRNLAIIIGFLGFLVLCGCGLQELEPLQPSVPPTPPTVTQITGTVVDDAGTPVSGAKVSLIRAGVVVGVATTDDQGSYTFTNVQPGTYQIIAEKEGYTSGSVNAIVKTSGAGVSAITISVISQVPTYQSGVISASSGGVIETISDAEGKRARVEIPPNGLQADALISVTLLYPTKMVPMPGLLATYGVSFEGAPGSVITAPATIHFPLPFPVEAGARALVRKFNKITGTWENTGVVGTVSSDGLTLTGEVTGFGTYSIAASGAVNTKTIAEQTIGTQPITGNEILASSITRTVRIDASFPQGLPAGVSSLWALAIVEQKIGFPLNRDFNITIQKPSGADQSVVTISKSVTSTITATIGKATKPVGTDKTMTAVMGLVWRDVDIKTNVVSVHRQGTLLLQ